MSRNYTPQELNIPPVPKSLRMAAKKGATHWQRSDSHFILYLTGAHRNTPVDPLTQPQQEEIIKNLTGSNDPTRLSGRRFETLKAAFQVTCKAMVKFIIKSSPELLAIKDALLESFSIEMENSILKFEHVGPGIPINLWIELPIFTDNEEISRCLYNKALFSNYNPKTKEYTSFNAIPEISKLQNNVIKYDDISSIASDDLIEASSTSTPRQSYKLPINSNETLSLAIIQAFEILSKDDFEHFRNQCVLWVASIHDSFITYVENNSCTVEAIATLLFEYQDDIKKMQTPTHRPRSFSR